MLDTTEFSSEKQYSKWKWANRDTLASIKKRQINK